MEGPDAARELSDRLGQRRQLSLSQRCNFERGLGRTTSAPLAHRDFSL